jgi:hypothetical protein
MASVEEHAAVAEMRRRPTDQSFIQRRFRRAAANGALHSWTRFCALIGDLLGGCGDLSVGLCLTPIVTPCVTVLLILF